MPLPAPESDRSINRGRPFIEIDFGERGPEGRAGVIAIPNLTAISGQDFVRRLRPRGFGRASYMLGRVTIGAFSDEAEMRRILEQLRSMGVYLPICWCWMSEPLTEQEILQTPSTPGWDVV